MSVWNRARSAFARLFAPPLPLTALAAASAPVSSIYARQMYSPEHALSAMAAYPWAAVAWTAIGNDSASLPLALYTEAGEPVRSHWFLELMKRPDPEWSGVRWRRQLMIDYLGAGMAYIRVYRTPTGRPYRLRRLHPSAMERIGDEESGDLLGWKWRGKIDLRPEEVIVLAMPSWRNDVNAENLGESPVRALDVSIQAAIDSRKQAGVASKRGRHEVTITPRGETIMGPQATKKVRDEYEASAKAGHGALVMSHGVDVTPISLTARDTEWHRLGTDTRDETLARYNVPPVRAQLPSANYGAAKQEMRQYWESGVRPHTDLFDAELSWHLLRAEGLACRHSYEHVEALQTSYTERLNRATVWVDRMGATPYEAAQHEGFAEPPVAESTVAPSALGQQTQPLPARPELQVDTPQARDELAAALARCAELATELADDPEELAASCTLALWPVMPRGSAATLAEDIAAGHPEALSPTYARRLAAALDAA